MVISLTNRNIHRERDNERWRKRIKPVSGTPRDGTLRRDVTSHRNGIDTAPIYTLYVPLREIVTISMLEITIRKTNDRAMGDDARAYKLRE